MPVEIRRCSFKAKYVAPVCCAKLSVVISQAAGDIDYTLRISARFTDYAAGIFPENPDCAQSLLNTISRLTNLVLNGSSGIDAVLAGLLHGEVSCGNHDVDDDRIIYGCAYAYGEALRRVDDEKVKTKNDAAIKE